MAYPYNPIASSTNPYLNSILHGTAWNTSASNGSAAKVITYSIDDGSLAFSPTQAEAATFTQAEAALINSAVQCYENVCDIDFVQVPLGNPNDPEHYENIVFVACNQDMMSFLSEGRSLNGAATPPWGDNWLNKFIDIEDWDNALFDVSAVYINCDSEYLTQDGPLAQGGSAHYLILHEFGHALGLAHPHDNSGRSSVFPGVLSPYDFGDYSLNQAIFTTMSYNIGWQTEFGSLLYYEYGHNGTPGAFDIAALQQLYGANTSYKTGADTYVLPTANDIGTFFSCLWDAGGDDTISNQGSSFACTINLIAAPLTGPNAGGYVSWNDGIWGGYTIANGVIIENAIGGAGDDFIAGNEFDNTINGDTGSDLLDGGAGNDTLIGGEGNDTVSYGSATAAVTVSLAITKTQNTKGAGTDKLSTIENLTGSSFNDVLTGSSATNVIMGGAGNDVINGGGGIDTLDGGEGSDVYLVTRLADKTAAEITDTGTTGTDELRFAATSAGTLTVLAGDTGFESVVIGTGTGSSAVVKAQTALNVDATSASNGLSISGNGGANTLTGSAFADTLDGGVGNDTLIGGEGADTLIGGLGQDTLTGGTGADIFKFSLVGESRTTATKYDVITDFVQGEDKIDLSAIDAFAASKNVNDTFIWQGTAAFSNKTEGEVRYQTFDATGTSNDYTMIWIDNDKNTGVEMAIRLSGLHDLIASDFIL